MSSQKETQNSQTGCEQSQREASNNKSSEEHQLNKRSNQSENRNQNQNLKNQQQLNQTVKQNIQQETSKQQEQQSTQSKTQANVSQQINLTSDQKLPVQNDNQQTQNTFSHKELTKTQTQQQQIGQDQGIKSPKEQDLNSSKTISEPSQKIQEDNIFQSQTDREAKQEVNRLREFRRKHMIFPKKEQIQHRNKQPLANKVLAETFSSIKNKLHHNSPQQIHNRDYDQSRMIAATTTSKKKENFKLFQVWNQTRSKNLTYYAYVCENLLKGADFKIRQSLKNFQIFMTFFKQRSNQEQKYSSQPVIDVGYSLGRNQIGSTAFGDSCEIMKIVGQFNLERCKKIQNFAYLINKNIIADLLQNHLNKSHHGLNSLRQKLASVKNAINQVQKSISLKTVELASFVEDHPPMPQIAKDFYLSQLQFLRYANDVNRMFGKYGQFSYEYYVKAAEIEKERMTTVKSAIKVYVQGLVQTYQFQSTKLIQEKLNNDNSKSIQSVFKVSELIDPKLQQFVKRQLQLQTDELLTVDILQNYIRYLPFQTLDSRLLILKQFKTVNVRKDIPNETCNLIITVDKYLHIFLNTEGANIYADPSQTFKIDQALKITRKGSVVQIVKVQDKKGVMSYIIWQAPTTYTYVIQFAKDDLALEFQDCVKKLL